MDDDESDDNCCRECSSVVVTGVLLSVTLLIETLLFGLHEEGRRLRGFSELAHTDGAKVYTAATTVALCTGSSFAHV